MKKQVGIFTTELLNYLPTIQIVAGTPIYLGDSNISHMKTSHPDDYQKYGTNIEQILAKPDYIGINKKDSSIEFVKEYLVDNEFVKVAVRISTQGTFYARSLYVLKNSRVENFIKKGTLKKLTK